MTDEWPNVCVVCATRKRQTRLKHGHCCAGCADRIAADLRAIPELAAMAAASLVPGSGSGGAMSTHYGPKEPIRLEAVDPALAHVNPDPDDDGSATTVLELLESWARIVRDDRGLTRYGPASEQHVLSTGAAINDTTATLVGVCAFLGAHVGWIVSDPEFLLEGFAREVALCKRAVIRWDTERKESDGWFADCPHDAGGGTCGYRLRIDGNDVDSYFICPRCGSEWSVDRLMLVAAETSDASMWLDCEAVIKRYGVDRTTLERWVRKGRITKWHGLYDVRPLALAQRRGA